MSTFTTFLLFTILLFAIITPTPSVDAAQWSFGYVSGVIYSSYWEITSRFYDLNIYHGVKLSLLFTAPPERSIDTTELYGIAPTCTLSVVTQRGQDGSVTSILSRNKEMVLESLNRIGPTAYKIGFSFFDKDLDFASLSCRFYLASQLNIVADLALSTSISPSEGYFDAAKYATPSGIISTGTTMPLMSIQVAATNLRSFSVTLFDIHDGRFGLNNILIRWDHVIQASLEFSTAQWYEFPELVNAQVNLKQTLAGEIGPAQRRYIAPAITYLEFSNIPIGLKEITINLKYQSDITASTVFIPISMLREQISNNFVTYQGITSGNPSRISPLNLPPQDHRKLISISPSKTIVQKNGFKFTFLLKPTGNFKLAFVFSPLTHFLTVHSCSLVTEGGALAGQSIHVDVQHQFILEIGAVAPNPTAYQASCEVLGSSVLPLLDYSTIVNSGVLVFELQSPVSLYIPGRLPAVDVSSFLSAIRNNAVGPTITVGGQYGAFEHTFLDAFNGDALVTLAGTKTHIRMGFPGSTVSTSVHFTLPIAVMIGGDRLTQNPFIVGAALYYHSADIFFKVTRELSYDGLSYIYIFDSVGESVVLIDSSIEFCIYRATTKSLTVTSGVTETITEDTYYSGFFQQINLSTLSIPILHVQHGPDKIPTLNTNAQYRISDLGYAYPPQLVSFQAPLLFIQQTGFQTGLSLDGINTQIHFKLTPDIISNFDSESALYKIKPRILSESFLKIKLVDASLNNLFFKFVWFTQPFDLVNNVSIITPDDQSYIGFEFRNSQDVFVLEDIEIVVGLYWVNFSQSLEKSQEVSFYAEFGNMLDGVHNTNVIRTRFTHQFSMASKHTLSFESGIMHPHEGFNLQFPSNTSPEFLISANTNYAISKSDTINLLIQFNPQIVLQNAIPTMIYTQILYFPLIPNSSLSTPSFDTIPIPIAPVMEHIIQPNSGSVTLPVTSNLPESVAATKAFVKVRYSYHLSEPLEYEGMSYTFAIVPACITPPVGATGTDIWNVHSMVSTCGQNGNCSRYGQCECFEGYQGEQCEIQIAVDYCVVNQCNVDNTKTCTDNGLCICNDGWGGDKCQVQIQCVQNSQKLCSNGHLIPTETSTCSTICSCDENWSGISCKVCELKCLNDGQLFNNCEHCGCQAGFTGDTCQCRAFYGSIVLGGYSPYHVLFEEFVQLASTGKPTYQRLEVLKPYLILHNDLLQQFIDILLLDQQPQVKAVFTSPSIVVLKNEDRKPVSLVLTLTTSRGSLPSTSSMNKITTMSFKLVFNCKDFSQKIDLDLLQSRWTKLVEAIPFLKAVTENFIFLDPNNPKISKVNDLLPSIASLPSDDDKYVESSSGIVHTGTIYDFLLICIVFVGMLF